MSAEFDEDRARLEAALEAARGRLLAVLDRLDDAALERGRRGGWTVQQVIEHIVDSEVHYAAGIAVLRGQPVDRPAPASIGSIAEARAALEASRRALLDAATGVGEETFYEVKKVLHQDYSVMSILENVESHDEEHARQIERTLA